MYKGITEDGFRNLVCVIQERIWREIVEYRRHMQAFRAETAVNVIDSLAAPNLLLRALAPNGIESPHKNTALLYVLEHLSENGTLIAVLQAWLNKHGADVPVEDQLAQFVDYQRGIWPDVYDRNFGADFPYKERVVRRIQLRLKWFISDIHHASADIPLPHFDPCSQIGLLKHILGEQIILDTYDDRDMKKLDHLNNKGLLIYHAVNWLDMSGEQLVCNGVDANNIAAGFADYICSLNDGQTALGDLSGGGNK